MKKLRLNLDELELDTFLTDEAGGMGAPAQGTVKGYITRLCTVNDATCNEMTTCNGTVTCNRVPTGCYNCPYTSPTCAAEDSTCSLCSPPE